jgi:hypothetical protein
MSVCILSHDGEIVLHRNMKAAPEAFLNAIAPDREGLVVAVECIFTGYWLADLCAQEGLPFVLGHALYMKAIHGGKAKHDQIDSQQIAALLRGGMLPQAYVYPAEMRATRDRLRRCTHLMRKRSELLSHVQHTHSPYNLPEIGKNIAYKANRQGVAERFEEAAVQKSIEVDLALITYDDKLLKDLELWIMSRAIRPSKHTLLRTRYTLFCIFRWRRLPRSTALEVVGNSLSSRNVRAFSKFGEKTLLRVSPIHLNRFTH